MSVCDFLICLFRTVSFLNPQVSELIREQSFLKSELGLGLGDLGLETLPAEGTESVFSHGNSDSSSVCSGHAGRKAGVGSSELTGKSKGQSKKLYRASVALTPTPPVRPGAGQQVESSEELVDSTPEMEQKLEKVPLVPSVDDIHKSVEQEELQQVIREVRREGLRSKVFEQCLPKPKDRLAVTLGHGGFLFPLKPRLHTVTVLFLKAQRSSPGVQLRLHYCIKQQYFRFPSKNFCHVCLLKCQIGVNLKYCF